MGTVYYNINSSFSIPYVVYVLSDDDQLNGVIMKICSKEGFGRGKKNR